MKKTNINFSLKSWKGKRKVNQDNLGCSYNTVGDFCAVVCDGVGSVAHSEQASKLVARVFNTEWEKTGRLEKPTVWFKQTLALALTQLKELSVKKNLGAIATTIAVLLVIDKKFYAYNIGDTRIYLIDKQEAKQYTYDHNYKNFLIMNDASEANINANEAKWHSLTNFIDPFNPTLAKFDTNSGNITQKCYFLVCTDGLYGYVSKPQMVKLANKEWLPVALKATIFNFIAYHNKSKDNISCILVRVK